MPRVLPILALALLALACRSKPAPAFQEDLLGTCWVLVSIDGAAPLASFETTICFEEAGRVHGTGGCNNYFATARFEGERLSIGHVGATRIACAREVLEQEQRFFQRLSEVRRWLMDGGELSLYGEEPPALRFERARGR